MLESAAACCVGAVSGPTTAVPEPGVAVPGSGVTTEVPEPPADVPWQTIEVPGHLLGSSGRARLYRGQAVRRWNWTLETA